MLFQKYKQLNQEIFSIESTPEAIEPITDIAAYNLQEGLSLNDEEVSYLEKKQINQP